MEQYSIFIAYAGLGLMAVIPIYAGSYQSVPAPEGKKKKDNELLSSEDAYWFPIIGSIMLFSFYILFKFLSKEMINMVITAYFAAFGTVALWRLVTPWIKRPVHYLLGWHEEEQDVSTKKASVAESTKETASSEKDVAEDKESWKSKLLTPVSFQYQRKSDVVPCGSLDVIDVLSLVGCIAFTVIYVMSKHWILSNIFGLSFSISAISLLHLDSFVTGSILLGGLFIYDIFWVFGTNVMVTVAKNFDAPIKMLFPRNIFADKFEFALLGLGDIVIPGIFVALALRFDHQQAGKPEHMNFPKPYFKACFVSYIIGLATTIIVMHTFQAAQPALLYLSPACILSILITSLIRGEFAVVRSYSAESTPPEKTPLKSD